MSDLFEAWGRGIAAFFRGDPDPMFIENRQPPGWKEPASFYLFKCPIHGGFEDSWHGYSGFGSNGHLYTMWTLDGWMWVDCPECTKERRPERVAGDELGFYAAYAEEEEHHRPKPKFMQKNEVEK